MPPTTLAVLAGGQGKRMGMPKALLRVHDQPLLEWLLDRWQWPGPIMVVMAPGIERPQGMKRLIHWAVDPVAGEGPLRGVLTALEQASTDLLLITTCDMPRITRANFDQLAATFETTTAPGVTFTRFRDGERAVEPFPMIIRRGALAAIRAAYDAGERSPARIAAQFQLVPFTGDEAVWLNLNRPADLRAFLETL